MHPTGSSTSGDDSSVREYAPDETYAVGDRVRLDDAVGDVMAVRRRGGPLQGSFSVIDVRTPAGEVRRMVAEVAQTRLLPASTGSVVSDKRPASGSPFSHSASVTRESSVFWHMNGGTWRRRHDGDSTLFGRSILARYWEGQAPADAQPAYEAVRAIWQPSATAEAENCPAATTVETAAGVPEHPMRLGRAETWRRWVEPSLQALGWWATPLPDGEAYALYPDRVSREVAVSRAGQGGSTAEDALALLVAVAEGSPLGRAPADVGMPGVSPALYLVGLMLSEGVAWGILTNGQEWRLYRAAWDDPDVGSTLEEYHRADIRAVTYASPAREEMGTGPGRVSTDGGIETGHRSQSATAWESFYHWFTVFRANAFVLDDDGWAPVERLKRARASYARDVVTGLRQQLLESVLPEIAGGFIVYRAEQRGATAESAETLAEILSASLALVYRMLFILYSEAREMLPMDNPDYRGQSLTTLLHWARDAAAGGIPLSRATFATPRYNGLITLFHRLEHGMPALGLPSYGRGLFNSVDGDVGFLEGHRLSDWVVARALTFLGSLDGAPIDYTTLSYRHLSAVGDGLLGNSLWVVDRSAGQVALVNDRGEPHVPASVPVPDFVGVAVIERAILDDLADREAAFAGAMDRVAALRRQTEDGAGERDSARAAAEKEACATLLDMRILDPAMGTGTFLVWAMDVLVDGIAKVLFGYHRSHPWMPWAWDPVVQCIGDVRQAVLDEALRQGVLVDPDQLEDAAILARLVAERAIYGVDLSATAVAVSRATVTMRAFAVGASFVSLGRHLRRGDSLTGVRLADFERAGVSPSDASFGDAQAGGQEAGSFTHWDLAFPEVFAAPTVATGKQSGFDIVIGSPPADAAGPASSYAGSSAFQAQARRLVRHPGGRVAFVMMPTDKD